MQSCSTFANFFIFPSGNRLCVRYFPLKMHSILHNHQRFNPQKTTKRRRLTMKSPNTTTSRSLPALGNPILAGREMLKGIALCPVKPQPFCRLVYSCMGDNCGKWVYPASNTWQEWNDEDYKRPDDISPDELKNVWISPYCIGDTVPVREPWAFMKCCDCYACETPQTRYRGNLGCFVFPTPQNQAYTQFKPARFHA